MKPKYTFDTNIIIGYRIRRPAGEFLYVGGRPLGIDD